MRIVHSCLASTYTENYGYQENILPRVHKRQGHEVLIIASTEKYGEGKKIQYVKAGAFINEDGIPVYRMPYLLHMNNKVARKIRQYQDIEGIVERFQPDIIFLHGTQSIATNQIVKYMKRHKEVRLYADCHADFNNSAKSFLSRRILHGMIYKRSSKRLLPYIRYYYGVLPARCEFLHDVYGIPKAKIRLLPMGVEDELAEEVKKNGSRTRILQKYCSSGDKLIVAGGKIDRKRKEFIDLMKVVNETQGITLIIFGSVDESIKNEFNEQLSQKVFYVGWLNVKGTYELLNSADLVVFPCLHSVMWEQAVGLGVPAVFHKIKGTTHIDNKGNCILLDEVNKATLKNAIKEFLVKSEQMKNAAYEFAPNFSYERIAKEAIEVYGVDR